MLQEVDSTQAFADEQPQAIEVTLEQFDELVLDKQALDRLLANPDYKRLVETKYCTYEFERLSGLLKSKNSQVVKERDIIVSKIVSIGHFENFFKDLSVILNGIDNPEQRLELLRQIDEYKEQAEKDAEEQARAEHEAESEAAS